MTGMNKRVDFTRRHKLIGRIRHIDMIGIRFLSLLLPKVLIPPPSEKVVLRTIHGFDLNIDPLNDRGVERRIYYSGTYEEGTLQMLSSLLRPGDIFVDVGANIGLMTVHASQTVGRNGRVIAFEPNPATREMLRSNCLLNRCENVQIMAQAAGSKVEKALIYDDPGSNRGRASLVRPAEAAAGHAVDVVRLDDALEDIDPIRLIKLDIEGFELEALRGALKILRRPGSPILIIECSAERENSHGKGIKPIYDLLQDIGGYRYFKLSKGKERRSRLIELKKLDEFPSHDNVLCLTEAHLSELRKEIFAR